MSNLYGPDCPDLQWRQGDQYATFIASSQAEYDAAVTARKDAADAQDLDFDGDPHLCASVGEDTYVVKLV